MTNLLYVPRRIQPALDPDRKNRKRGNETLYLLPTTTSTYPIPTYLRPIYYLLRPTTTYY